MPSCWVTMDGDDVPTIMARPIKRQHSNVAKLMAEACQSGDEATLVALIDKYGNVDEDDSRGNTPLMHAAWNGHVHLVDLLIKRGANVNVCYTAAVHGLQPEGLWVHVDAPARCPAVSCSLCGSSI